MPLIVPDHPPPLAGPTNALGAALTCSVTVLVTVVYFAVSVGVNVVESVWAPASLMMVPAGGVYAKVPATFAVALSWAADSAVPAVTGAGTAQVTVGASGPTVQLGVTDLPKRAPLGATMYVVQSGKFTRPLTMGYVTPL